LYKNQHATHDARRLEDDERLDTLLDQLQKKAPTVAAAKSRPGQHKPLRHRNQQQLGRSGGGGRGEYEGADGQAPYDDDSEEGGGEDDTRGGGTPSSCGLQSVKSQLAAEMRAVRRQLEELDGRAAQKAERAGVVPRGLQGRAGRAG
jgi:hypothetical protein